MDSSEITGYGRPENTNYDRARHGSMKLKPIGYGYFHTNRTIDKVFCELCKNEVENPVRFINKRPYHKECFDKVCEKSKH